MWWFWNSNMIFSLSWWFPTIAVNTINCGCYASIRIWSKLTFEIVPQSRQIKKIWCYFHPSWIITIVWIGLYHPLDGITNLKFKLLCFLTPSKKISKRKVLAFNRDRSCHLMLCLQLILLLLHYSVNKRKNGGVVTFSSDVFLQLRKTPEALALHLLWLRGWFDNQQD